MSTAEANRRYFDALSETYDSKPFFAEVNQAVTDDLRNRLDWIGIPITTTTESSSSTENIRQLDYACGTGLMSRVFDPYVTFKRGIDISPNMVASYNARARAAGIPASTINAAVGNLFDKSSPSPKEFSGAEWHDFDLATVGFGFHHFEDVVHAARCLKERLKPGGILLINDFLEGGDLKADEEGKPIEGTEGKWAVHHHGHSHSHNHDQVRGHDDGTNIDHESGWDRKKMIASIVTPSFTIEGVRNFFTEAGLVDVDVVTMDKRVYMEFGGQKVWRTILFARGKRPAEPKPEL